MPVFCVTWNADEIESESAREAAAYARNLIQRYPGVNSVFIVTDEEGNIEQIDLEDDEGGESSKLRGYSSAQKACSLPKKS